MPLSAEVVARIVELNRSGEHSIRAIARAVPCNPTTAAKYLARAGIAPGPAHGRGGTADGRRHFDQPNVTAAERAEFVRLVKDEALSAREIATRTGRAEGTVRRHLKAAAVTPMDAAARARRYPLDENAFATNSAARDYWAGVLASDGNVFGTKITLVQNNEGVELLTDFLAFVGAARPLLEHSSRTAKLASVYSAAMASDLAALGITPAKSATLRLSDELAASPAAWLGLLDGDGSLQVRTSSDHAPRIIWYGAEPVMRQCSAYWGALLHRSSPPAVYRPNVQSPALWAVALCGASAQHAAEVLLASHPTSLAAKRRKLEAIGLYASPRVRARKRRDAGVGNQDGPDAH